MLLVYGVADLRNYDLKKACREFAGSFFYEIFKKMYDTIPKSDLVPETHAERWFKEMLLYEYSRKAAESSLKPLVDLIYRTLSRGVWRGKNGKM